MTNVRYEPREFSSEPWAFGIARTILWVEVSQDDVRELAQLRASQIQHSVSYEIRCRYKDRYSTLGDLARGIGTDPLRLSRLMKGRQVMRIEDIASIERAIGPFAVPAFGQVDSPSSAIEVEGATI